MFATVLFVVRVWELFNKDMKDSNKDFLKAIANKDQEYITSLKKDIDLLHTALCQACACMNQAENLKAHNIIRQALDDYANIEMKDQFFT